MSRRPPSLRKAAAGLATALVGGTLFGIITIAATTLVSRPPAADAATPGPASAPRGYWLGATDGGIFAYGEAGFKGSMGGSHLNKPIVGMAPTPSGNGYWEVASDGGIFAFGDAAYAGSAGSLKLHKPVVAMAATPTGLGYWLVASDGGIFAYGDAAFKGSTGGKTLNAPIVGMAATPSGQGYWLVASDGGIFTFGDAKFLGSQGQKPLNKPVVSMAPTPSGLGYWLVASDGGIFTFGDAGFAGSTGGMPLNKPIAQAVPSPTGKGYWLEASDGGIFTFGDATFFGSAGSLRLAAPVVGMAAVPRRHPAQVVAFYYPWWGNPTFDGQWVHWDQGGYQPPWDIGADFYPTRDPYSSGDPNVLDAQFAEIANSGIDEVVVSWWGQGSYEDGHLGAVEAAAAAHNVKVGIHLEPYSGRTVATVASDIARLRGEGYRDFWLYEAMLLPGDQLQPVIDAAGSDVRILAETGNIGAVRNGTFAAWAADAHFTGIYTYDPVRYAPNEFNGICGGARERSLMCVPVTSPGFQALRSSDGKNTTVVSRNNGSTYDAKWAGALTAQPDLITITSYNEWHEGSQIEPAKGGCMGNSCYLNYEGAYGLSGDAAANAYMARTRFWADQYHASAS